MVGRSGNKSLDELVEADPDPTRKENTARKEAGKREQRKKSSHELVQRGRMEHSGRAGGGNGLRMEGFRVLVSCYPVCYGEDSRGRGGKQKSVFRDRSLNNEDERNEKRGERMRIQAALLLFLSRC